MNSDLRGLCRRLLHNVRHDQTDLADAVHLEPASHFVDPERHEIERSLFFMKTPQVVGFAGEVAEPNSYKAVTVADVPILITRSSDGVLRAFINACQHRGAQIAEGHGCKKALSCPFHGWTYGLDGSLVGRRHEDAFATTDHHNSLTPLAVSDNAGLLTVGPTPDITQAQVDDFLADIGRKLESFDFRNMLSMETRRFDVEANWKLVVNLSHEGYHFDNLHRTSLAPLMSSHGVVDYCGQHSRWAFPLRSITDLAAIEETKWPEHFPGSINHTLFPGTVVVATPGSAQLIRSEPGSTPGKCVVYFSGVYQRSENQDKDAQTRARVAEAFEFGGRIFVEEDLSAATQCQRGIAAGGLRHVVSGRNEPMVGYWHQIWNNAINTQRQLLRV